MPRRALWKTSSLAGLMTCFAATVLAINPSSAGMSKAELRRQLENGATWIDPASLEGRGLWIGGVDGGNYAFLQPGGVLLFTREGGKPTTTSKWRIQPVKNGPTELCLTLTETNACGPLLDMEGDRHAWLYKFNQGRGTDFPYASIEVEAGKPAAVARGEELAAKREALKARGILPEDLNLLKGLYFVFRIAEVCEDTGYHFTQDHLSEMTSLGQAISAMVNDAAEVDKAWAGAVQESDSEINIMAASGRAQTYEACKQRLQWWVLFKEPLKNQYRVVTPLPRNPF